MNKQPTPEEIVEHAKLKQQVMDMIDPIKNHARMERDRKAYERSVRERERQEAYEQGIKFAEFMEAKAKRQPFFKAFADEWKDEKK